MAAISNIGFALQAADVGVRTAIGLRRGYEHLRDSRSYRVAEYLDTLEECECTIENLHSGGAVLALDANHPLRSYVEKITATTASIRSLCGPDDIESQGVSEDDLIGKLADDDVWQSFLRLKTEISRLEKGVSTQLAFCPLNISCF